MSSRVLGQVVKMRNYDRVFGSANSYYVIDAQIGPGVTTLAFTQHEIKRALRRAAKNAEDVKRYHRYLGKLHADLPND